MPEPCLNPPQIKHAIQIAGIHDWAEARLLVDCGVEYLGFPLRLPVHKEDLTEEQAADIIRRLPSDCHAVAITYQNEAKEIAALVDFLGVNLIQLHGDIPIRELELLRRLRPKLGIIKSLIVGRDDPAVLTLTLKNLSPFVDAFITDTYDSGTGACGATGKIHDWSMSRELVERAKKPVILAGGLTPQNVADAIRSVKPAGVDAHTGVENVFGRKDREKVERFVSAAKTAFASLAD